MATLRRIAALLRLEDVLVAVLAGLVLPLVDRWLTGSGSPGAGSEPGPIVGVAGLVAIAGVLACLLTRGPDEPHPLADGELTLQGWARFPLAAGIGIVGHETLPAIGLPPEPLVGLSFAIVIVGAFVHQRLPVLAVPYRRLLVLPMAVLAAGAFDRIFGGDIEDILGGLVTGSAPPEVAFLWPLLLGAVAAVYVMLIVAPRAIADPGASGFAWLARFGLLLVAMAVAGVVGLR